MAAYIALLRGINVGTAKRVRMEDLRAAVGDLGFTDVRTLLNSGNVVFSSPRLPAGDAVRIEKAVHARTGISSRVTVISAAELAKALEACPLLHAAKDPSRLLVAVPSSTGDLKRLNALERQNWGPEALAVGPRVAYLWCADGIYASKVAKAVGRELRDGVTSRNWTTMTKLLDMARG